VETRLEFHFISHKLKRG